MLNSNKPSLSNDHKLSVNGFRQKIKSSRPRLKDLEKFTKIEFSRLEKRHKNTKNFTILNNGFPLRDKVINISFNEVRTKKKIIVPLLKTDHNGQLFMLINPLFEQNKKINVQKSTYVPVKFSKRLGFVIKSDTGKKNIFNRSKIVGKYIDLGLSEHFIRAAIVKSKLGELTLNGTNSGVCKNWNNAFLNNDDIKDEYKYYNTHTERTQKSRKNIDYIGYSFTGLGIASLITLGTIVSVGLLPAASIAVGGGILTVGSTQEAISRSLHSNLADISRIRNSKETADQELTYEETDQVTDQEAKEASIKHQNSLKEAKNTPIIKSYVPIINASLPSAAIVSS